MFPDPVGDSALAGGPDQRTECADFNIRSRSSWHALYAGTGEIDLFVYRTPGEDQKRVLEHVMEVLHVRGVSSNLDLKQRTDIIQEKKTDSSRTIVINWMPESYIRYELAPILGLPRSYGAFWWDEGWVFHAHSANNKNPDRFLRKYLLQIGTGKQVKPGTGGSAEKSAEIKEGDKDTKLRPQSKSGKFK
jgi:hypothetical protein